MTRKQIKNTIKSLANNGGSIYGLSEKINSEAIAEYRELAELGLVELTYNKLARSYEASLTPAGYQF